MEDYEYIRDTYHVPAKTGGRVRYTGETPCREGTIKKAYGQYLGIRLDGEKQIGRYHPTWALQYLNENGEIIVSFPA